MGKAIWGIPVYSTINSIFEPLNYNKENRDTKNILLKIQELVNSKPVETMVYVPKAFSSFEYGEFTVACLPENLIAQLEYNSKIIFYDYDQP